MPVLYYAPGTCSLSPNITLREAGIAFDLEKVDLATKTLTSGRDFRDINPKGYVPALVLDNGDLLTEGAVMVLHIADLVPQRELAPPLGTLQRLRLQEWLLFIATELHKGMSPMRNPKASDALLGSLKKRYQTRLAFLEAHMRDRTFIMGDKFSVADPYAFYSLWGWQQLTRTDLSQWPALREFCDRMRHRPTVQAALASEL